MKPFFAYVSLVMFVFLFGCKETVTLPRNEAQFETQELGLPESQSSITADINFSRAVDAAGEIVLLPSSSTLKYGVDYTTEPAVVNDSLKLSFAAKATSVSFQIKRVDGAFPRSGDEVNFLLQSIPNELHFGRNLILKLSFAEITVNSAMLNPNVGGPSQPNIVFVDLSANQQLDVQRDTWDLGFYTQGDSFRVILNPTCGMLARLLAKSDLGAVTAGDTTGFGKILTMSAVFAGNETFNKEGITWIDAPNGDLDSTAIAAIAAQDVDNKVYIINRGTTPAGTPRGWKKIRVLRNGTGYELRYADIDEENYQTVRVQRGEGTHLFRYVDFDAGIVTVTPQKEQWDIAFTTLVNTTRFGPPTGPLVPYLMKDMVIQSRYKVRTAQVMTADIAYDAFTTSDLANVELGTSQVNIGGNWRNPGGPTSAPSLLTDRFFVVQDVQGNVYKLQFTKLTQDGERGRPQIKFDLVQKGS